MNDTTEQQTDPTYNGWTNKETWLVSLWLDSDVRSIAFLDAIALQPKNLTYRAELLRDEMRDLMLRTQDNASLWTDLLSVTLYRINWREIIENHQ